MVDSTRALRVMQDEMDFLLDAHSRILVEQESGSDAKAILEIRNLAHRLRKRYASADEKKLTGRLRRMSVTELVGVGRAFTVFFWLLNIVEERHAERQRRHDEFGTFRSLFKRLRRKGLPAEVIRTTAAELRATIVLTAHPTEALRWSLRETLDRIDALLDRRQVGRGSARLDAEEGVLAEITGLWLSTTVRARKPTPLDEVRYAIHILQEVLVDAVPDVTEAMLTALSEAYPEEPSLRSPAVEHDVHRSLRIGSWMGGDRDGNPFVTAEITR